METGTEFENTCWTEQPRDAWGEYEQRKQEVEAQCLGPDDYHRKLQRIADELGL